MSAVIPPFPTAPDEVPYGVGLAQLVEAYNHHQVEVLVGRSAPANLDTVFRHALAALALRSCRPRFSSSCADGGAGISSSTFI